MRVLIVAAILACAAAVPSGLLAPYSHGLIGHGGLAVAHGAPLAIGHAAPLAVAHGPALPTISPGDIAGAAIDAHVDASDHARAAVDAGREVHDQAAEIHGQAVNAAEDHSWQAIDAVKTQEAQLDGAAAGVAPVLAKQLVGHGGAYAGYGYAGHGAGYAAPGLVASGLAYGAHGYGAHGYAAPAIASSKTVVSQSLSQTHPAPIVHAPLAIAHAPLGYSHGYSHGLNAHAW